MASVAEETKNIRYPLGLPPGSVRTVLSLMITALFCGLLLLPAEKRPPIPLFLYFLMTLLVAFFVAHGQTIGVGSKPFGLPAVTFRILVVAALAGTIGWLLYTAPAATVAELTPKPEQLKQWPYLLASIAGGFLLGHILRMGPWHRSATFQDILAWIAMLCMLGLIVETLAVVFVNPSLKEQMDLSYMEYGLTAMIALYFGARS